VISEMVDELSDEELAETLEEASYSAKAARAGKDIGKPGKMFGKIAASAAKRYGSAERGRKVAGAVLAKLRKMDEAEELDELDKSTLGSYVKKAARDVQQNTYRSGLSAARGVTNEPSISKTQKRQQGIAKAVNKLTSEDIEQTNEAQTSAAARYMKAKMSSQAKTTMKHVANPTAGEKQAAKDIKPGIAGYSDRVAMLKSAEKEGRLKEGMDPVGKEDSDINNDGKTDKSDSYLHNRRKAINRAMVKESIVIVTEQEIEIEIPSELSFADYLDAVKYLSKDDPTISEADIIKMATLAHKENDVDLILEAAYNRTREGDKMYSPELDADIDRSKPGVTRVTRRIKPGEGMGTKQSERKLMKRIASRNK
ncbi:hypothetical protein EBU95_08540, partial [bacterium]|nr:hypothetical protein [bacterium]